MDGLYVIELVGADGGTQEFAFSIDESKQGGAPGGPALVLRRSISRSPDGATQWEATYDDYVDVEGQSFPTTVRFIDVANGADTSVRVKSIAIDPEIPDGAFQQTPAPGMTVDFAACP